MGAVTQAVKRYLPATYNEMIVVPTDTSRLFATTDLQALADYVKYRLFATVVTESDESIVFNPAQSQFLGKLTTLQFIPAAVDFWDSRLASLVSTGTNEEVQYRDHRDGLLKLWEILSKEVKQDAQLFGYQLSRSGLLPAVSYGDNGRGILITPDPMDFPPLDEPQIPWIDLVPWKTI